MEKTISRSFITLIMLFLTVFSSSGAGVTPPPEWTVNPADYRYDMSLYFNVAFASSKQTVDLSQYEIASFVGDECRGVAEAISGVENCLYMRIHSNSENGETISFKIRNRQTGDVTEIENETIPFEADKAVGLPSAPLNIAIVTYYDVNITATTGGSVNFKNGRYAEGTTLEVTAIPDPNYSFVSWSDGVTEPTRAITVDNDITLEASFEAEKYTLTYIIDGVTIESVKLEFGAKITPVQAPEKPGYTFAGWEGLPETMPANDVTVTGNYTLNKYKLAYVIDGINVETVELEFGAKINPIEAPAKEGHTFAGWTGFPEDMVMPANDVTVTGSYTINKYKLAYVIDGKNVETVELEFGAKINPIEAPAKEGYTFAGWEGLPETMPANDVTVNAVYTVNTYKLTYIVDGENYKTVDVEFGAKITPVEAPVKEGHTFARWEGIPETMPANDVTVNAVYTVNTYKLTYIVDGESYKTVDVEFGAKINPVEAPAKEGHTFARWEGLPETMPANDVTVNAVYTVNSYKLTYIVDGENYKTVDVEFGAKINPVEAPAKEGHTFARWEGLPETMPANDVTVNAVYTVNSYKLTYIVDGESYKTVDVEFGAKINPVEAPAKEGYTFARWEGIPETMPANDVTVNAVYTVNSYKLTYIVDGESYKTADVEYGAEITPADAPEKEGYTFAGWDGLPDFMPAKDITVSAYYTVNYYKLTVYVDGELFYETELEMGAPIEIPEPEIPSDRIFDGWVEDVPDTMPAHDVEIHGTTSAQSALSSIFVDENTLLTVYNLSGRLLLKDVTIREASDRLSKGIYIINGRKVIL